MRAIFLTSRKLYFDNYKVSLGVHACFETGLNKDLNYGLRNSISPSLSGLEINNLLRKDPSTKGRFSVLKVFWNGTYS